MTVDQIVMEIEERFGYEPKRETVRKAAHRLVTAGYVTSELEWYDDYDRPPKTGDVEGYRAPLRYQTYRRMQLSVA